MDETTPLYTWWTPQQVAEYNLPLGATFSPVEFISSSSLESAKTEAEKTGNFDWAKTLDYVLKYGGTALQILVATGVIKTQNDLYSGNINSSAFSKLDGSVPLPEVTVTAKRSLITGIDNTILYLAVAVILVLLLTKDKKKSK